MKIFDGMVPVDRLFKSSLKNKIEKEEISIQFDYPMEVTVMKFKNKDGFDVAKIIQCITEGYAKVYQNPEKYRIWGHDIEDLVIGSIYYDKKRNLITMDMSS